IYINKLKQNSLTNTLYTKKKNRKLKLYINYRYLNKAIIKNYYFILLILELIDKLRGAKWFIFKIRYKLFKYLTIINYILREYLDVFIIIYLNNILIYINRILEKYVKYIKRIL
ncbi:hypothetical protein K469DRAFT_575110, partial [Zopfia rhizophila CBS 207.26]